MVRIFKKNWLYVYIDGCCLPLEKRRGGIGIRYIYLNESEEEFRIDGNEFGYKSTTNNQMELEAAIKGLRGIKDLQLPKKYNNIQVRSDSRYVVDNISKAIYLWSKQKWLDRYGKPVENAVLWKELIKVLTQIPCRVEFEWVKGHAKDPDQKAVDRLAKESAQAPLNPPISIVKLRRKKSKKLTKRGSVEMKGQRLSIHIINEEYLKLQKLSKYRYEVISKRSEYYENVDFAYSEIHNIKAGHNYVVSFNKNNKNPRILRLIKEIE
jgi:ribonuclease HI